MQPSTAIMQALLSLRGSLDDLGMPSPALAERGIVQQLMNGFVKDLLRQSSEASSPPPLSFVLDVLYLRRLLSTLAAETTMIDDACPRVSWQRCRVFVASNPVLFVQLAASAPSDFLENANKAIDLHIPRVQVLLGPLLGASTPVPSKDKNSSRTSASTLLLPYGAPPTEQDFQPVMRVVKPCPRFVPLLLAGTR
jgi:hypothetical protein